MKKILLVVLFLLSISSCVKNEKILFMGDFSSFTISYISDQKIIDPSFTYEKMNSNDLYKIVNKDASYVQGDSVYKVSSKVKTSSIVVLSIGIYDFIPCLNISIENNLFEVDNEQVEKKKEIFEYNLEHILEEIHLINSKIKIFLISPISFFDFEIPEQKLFSSFLFDLYLTTINIDEFEYVEIIETFDLVDEKDLCDRILEWI